MNRLAMNRLAGLLSATLLIAAAPPLAPDRALAVGTVIPSSVEAPLAGW